MNECAKNLETGDRQGQLLFFAAQCLPIWHKLRRNKEPGTWRRQPPSTQKGSVFLVCRYRMLFRRRRAPNLAERIRVSLWPRRSWRRSARYVLLRIKRLPFSSHRIALGCAVGVFAIFTPFLGAQLLMCAVFAWMLRASVLAAFLTSFAGNPLTYPLIWVSTYYVGQVMLADTGSFRLSELQNRATSLGEALHEASPRAVIVALEALWPILKPMVVGSLPLGGIAAVMTYAGVWWLTSISRAAQLRRRLQLRAAPVSV